MNNTLTIANLKEECRLYMAEVGLPCDKPLIANGQFQRYSVDEKKNEPDEWYIAHEGLTSQGNAYLNCIFGSWSQGSRYNYNSFASSHLYTSIEKKELKKLIHIQSLNTEKAMQLCHNTTAKEAELLWSNYATNPPSEEYTWYLKVKGIEAANEVRYGLNPQGYPSIIIPVKNIKDEIRSLQFISLGSNGKSHKHFLSGGEKKGNFCILGNVTEQDDIIFIAEGFATAKSVFMAVNKPSVIAFDAGNIEPVIQNLKIKFPYHTFIIAGDNDETGKKKANNAAQKFLCKVVFPHFPTDKQTKNNKDFNDLHQICGIAVVKQQLLPFISDEELIDLNLQEFALKYLSHNEEPCNNFKLSKLPPKLREYINAIRKATNAHPLMITASVLTMTSGFVGTKIYISEGEYYQNLYPNFWFLCIAKSGQFKTTALNKGAKIAYENQAQVFKEIKALKDNFIGNITTIEHEIIKISRNNVILPTKITAEAFLEYLSQGHQGSIYASEFGGWLQNLDKTHNNDFKAIFTEFYDVPEYYRYKTKTQGDCVIEKPFISICGVSAMPWVRSNIKPTDVPSGFFARFLIFTPPYQNEIPSALPLQILEAHIQEETKFKAYLNHILNCIGDSRSYHLTPEAKDLFERLHILIYHIPKAYGERAEDILQPYLKRWSPYLLKIAMIMQLFINPETNELSEEAIKIAFHILLPAMKSTAALFEGELGESEHQRKCRILFEWICQKIKETGKPLKRHTIISSKKLDGGSKEYDYVLETLIDQGKIEYKELAKKNESEYSLVENN